MSAIPLTAVLVMVFLLELANGRSVSPGNTNTSSGNQTDMNVGCSPAFQLANTTSMCHRFYNHSMSLCNRSIAPDTPLYANMAEQIIREYKLKSIRIKPEYFRNSLPNPATLLRKRCFQIIQDMYCHYYFPRCDTSSGNPQPQAICREACEILNFMCKPAWLQLMHTYPGVTWYAQDEIGERMHEHETLKSHTQKNILMKCSGLPRMDGPKIPECYIPKDLLYKTMIEIGNGTSQDCYYGNGFAYRGNVSRTHSGYECQSWSEQCPHRHLRTPEKYKELIGADNACRNPGHQAPSGPWCYTTNPLVRWEYCNITKCPQAHLQNVSQMTIKAINNVIPSKIKNPMQHGIKKTNSGPH
ncbi:muscle, skeletal receptor tyrosine protein kinase-like isoform X2 [Actinia tenebrosa]|uniref:Muscle, skeletal receptor tyrosine protein kinase-like isoform X2 n=1 Tax=Actinia tenebrosa TaxID=6105 RepID=A0A6P8I8N7_ACTTE|nr:muscle, skeletal receptor tyrosine protein kinase-like isoform X2 [Actinia tenebrosa]